jgi:hypothetical protein
MGLGRGISISRHPQESFGFQRLLLFTTKPLEVAKADSCGCLVLLVMLPDKEANSVERPIKKTSIEINSMPV